MQGTPTEEGGWVSVGMPPRKSYFEESQISIGGPFRENSENIGTSESSLAGQTLR